MTNTYTLAPDLVLGTRKNSRVPEADQTRQRAEVEEILHRLHSKPGVILADEAGMGKTFVALAVAYSVAVHSQRGPVVLMVPANLVDKWEQDLKTFCELYLENRVPVQKGVATRKALNARTAIRYGVARHSIELLKLLDDPPRERCHLIFLAQGAMAHRQSDKWVRLALIAAALKRHGRGGANRLIQVKNQIHRFLAELLWAIGEERANDLRADVWRRLLRTKPATWKKVYNRAVKNENWLLADEPVPMTVIKTLRRVHLDRLAEALEALPVVARGGDERVSVRLNDVRQVLRQVEADLWKEILAEARWRSPLLVMDEAHHLKNPGTSLARQLQSADLEQDLRTGDGAMANVFERMLFLTATPFQLGHHELVSVLRRFGDVRWDSGQLGSHEDFSQRLNELGQALTDSQRTAIGLQRAWSKLRPEDGADNVESWWENLSQIPHQALNNHQRAVVEAFEAAKNSRGKAEQALRPWIVRHNKGAVWAGTSIARRRRVDGAAIMGQTATAGLPIPAEQLLPFFLAARSAVNPSQDVLGEALSSSYEAFRSTRKSREVAKDEQEESVPADFSNARWFLKEFDNALERCSGSAHPKMTATVRKAVDLWEAGEKVLVFAFYRYTCRALRIHISDEIEKRSLSTAERRLQEAGWHGGQAQVERLLDRAQRRYFDDVRSPGRKAVDAELHKIVSARAATLEKAGMTDRQRETVVEIMRRFLRVTTTLARCFPLGELNSLEPEKAIAQTLDYVDASDMSWRKKFDGFVEFLTTQCSTEERKLYLEAAERTQTGGIRVEDNEDEGFIAEKGRVTLANVQVATGKTKRSKRARLMRAFNTPFFPDILVCSEVMGEGVDLQRFCRHVIHHDLAWNPSAIEQRTGRIDRLGCKAEGRQPIEVYLPYLAGTADERQYRVMSDREQWFRVVIGQDEVARLITQDTSTAIPLPTRVSDELSFKLGLERLTH